MLKRNKLYISKDFIVALPLIVFQYILFAFNTYNADMENYIRRFNNIRILGPDYFDNYVDIGFNYFIYFCQKFNLDYQGFLILLGIIIFSSLIYICKVYKASYLVFFSFFFFTLYFLEVVIIRQFLASMLIAYSFNFIDKDRVISFKVLLIFFVAISIHITSIFAFIYYLVVKLPVKKVLILSLLGTALSFMMTSRLLPILTGLLGAKFALYTAANAGVVSYLAKIIFLLVTTLLFYATTLFIRKRNQDYTRRQTFISEIALKVTFANYMLIPLMKVDISFERLLIVPIFIYLVVAGILFRDLFKMDRMKLGLFLLWGLWIILTYRIFIWSNSAGTIDAILTFNQLWNR